MQKLTFKKTDNNGSILIVTRQTQDKQILIKIKQQNKERKRKTFQQRFIKGKVVKVSIKYIRYQAQFYHQTSMMLKK